MFTDIERVGRGPHNWRRMEAKETPLEARARVRADPHPSWSVTGRPYRRGALNKGISVGEQLPSTVFAG